MTVLVGSCLVSNTDYDHELVAKIAVSAYPFAEIRSHFNDDKEAVQCSPNIPTRP